MNFSGVANQNIENADVIVWDDDDWLKHLPPLERGLLQQPPDWDALGANIIGYGEISSIIQLKQQPQWVLKRMPVFSSTKEAQNYLNHYLEYLDLLSQAGLKTPAHKEFLISGSYCCLYLLQQSFSASQIGPEVIRKSSPQQASDTFQMIFTEIKKVFQFNQNNKEQQISCDGQLSNWAIVENEIFYIDTSTPLYRKHSVEQLPFELLLKSTPKFLRPVIRKFFLQDVLDRYYNRKLVFTDLLANLYKENLSIYVPDLIKSLNSSKELMLSENEIKKYYREDKFIWRLFLFFKKIDRWLHHHIYHQHYLFILPNSIKR